MFRELSDLSEDPPKFQRQRDRIVERCLPLADHIARRFDGRGEPRDDLVQVARVGLVNAVIRFNVDAGSDFVSFAVPTIMGEVRRHFRDNSWSVKVPRRLKELHLRLGRRPLNCRSGSAVRPPRRNSPPNWRWTATRWSRVSWRAAPTTPCRSTAVAAAPRRRPRSPTRSATSTSTSTRSRTEKRCGRCSQPSRARANVLLLRFFESMTQTQIAERVGISQMHVSRLLAKSLARLRDQLE